MATLSIPSATPQRLSNRQLGLEILRVDPTSNIGWRLVLEFEAAKFATHAIAATEDGTPLSELLPRDYRDRILEGTEAWGAAQEAEVSPINSDGPKGPTLRVTSFEGAKGLSAQHLGLQTRGGS